MIEQEVLKSGKIVIIDDDDMINEVLTYILEEVYEVRSYLNAEDAIQGEELGKFDVVITDVNLPGMNGIEFLERVQVQDENIPVIVITGFNDIDVAISALKKGAFDFILKPFKNDQILLSVKKAMERRRLLLENITLLRELRKKNSELETLNRKIQARNFEIENELEIASNLQQCLFPLVVPEIHGIRTTLKFKPVEKITGDIFEFIIHDESKFSVIFADVSGHGVPAALYSAMVKTAIGLFVAENIGISESMAEMNSFLINSQKKLSYNYVTMFHGFFDLGNGVMTYCNAGIPAPAVMRQGGNVEFLEPNGPFVGIFENSEYEEKRTSFKEGDTLILYTDGAFECSNAGDKILGHSMFMKNLRELSGKPMEHIVAELFLEVERYCGSERYVDDVTILGVHYGD
jgi:serine phosphatase RsbU (regulator of sigma subunit)/CheY-like chemotaxis protein